MAELSEIDQLKLELKRKEVELEILKKYFKAISGYDTCGDGGIIVKKIE